MREIEAAKIADAVEQMCRKAAVELPVSVEAALKEAHAREQSPLGRSILEDILRNAEMARAKGLPICQDTGTAVLWVQLGQDARIVGGDVTEALNEGVRRGYQGAYLRKSIVEDPLRRKNTGDNTPAAIHWEIVPGEGLRLRLLPKGGGCENMSRMAVLRPGEGAEGVKKFVVDAVRAAGANPCPPVVLGVGIGGTADQVTWLAKKALFRDLGDRHPDPFYADLEQELLTLVNDTGIGPQGLGGTVTALAVKVETWPCHITALPVAVCFNCHAARAAEVVL